MKECECMKCVKKICFSATFWLVLYVIFLIFLYKCCQDPKIDFSTLIAVIPPVIIGRIAWHQEKEKDREATKNERASDNYLKQRDIRLEYLIKAYNQIAMGVNRIPATSEFCAEELKEKNAESQRGMEEAVSTAWFKSSEQMWHLG